MTPELIVTILVFAPLLGAAVVGLSGRRLGNIASQAITTGLLLLACGLSWYTFSQQVWGGAKPFLLEIAPFIDARFNGGCA